MSATPVTRSRLRPRLVFAGTWTAILVCAFYALYLADLLRGRIRGPDFIAYYVGGRLARIYGGAHLYDLTLQGQIQSQITSGWPGHPGLLAFVNPPFLALLMQPLSYLTYKQAYIVWLPVTIAFTLGAVALAVRAGGLHGGQAWRVALMTSAAMPLFVGVLQGQSTSIVMFGLAGGYYLTRRQRGLLAGGAYSLVLLKPHLVLLLPVYLLARRQWGVLAGLCLGAAVLILIPALVWGPAIWPQYARLVLPQAAGIRQNWRAGTEIGYTLLGLVSFLGSWKWAAWSVLALGGALAVWKLRAGPALDFALMLAVSFLLAPHANFHDASPLVVGTVLVAARVLLSPRRRWHDEAILAVLFVLGVLSIAAPQPLLACLVLAYALWLAFVRRRLDPAEPEEPRPLVPASQPSVGLA